jgi:hypothetical protein
MSSHIIDFFSRTPAFQVIRFIRYVPLGESGTCNGIFLIKKIVQEPSGNIYKNFFLLHMQKFLKTSKSCFSKTEARASYFENTVCPYV